MKNLRNRHLEELCQSCQPVWGVIHTTAVPLSPSFQTQSMPSMPHRWWHQYQLPRGHRNYSRIEEPQRQGHVMQWQSSMKLLFMQLVHFGSFQITWSLDSQIVRSHRSLYFTWHQIRTSRIRRVRLKEQASLQRFEDVATETPKKTLRPFVRCGDSVHVVNTVHREASPTTTRDRRLRGKACCSRISWVPKVVASPTNIQLLIQLIHL